MDDQDKRRLRRQNYQRCDATPGQYYAELREVRSRLTGHGVRTTRSGPRRRILRTTRHLAPAIPLSPLNVAADVDQSRTLRGLELILSAISSSSCWLNCCRSLFFGKY